MLLAGGFAFISCSEPGTIGVEVLPDSDQPGVYFDTTIVVEATTIREDSLRSDEGVAGFNLAGGYADPVFGLARASFYAQVRLPNNNASFTFGTNPELDSVVLTLAYADFYGDTLTPMQFEVFQTEETVFIDSNYYTNDHLNLGRKLYPVVRGGSVPFSLVKPKDSVLVSGAKRAPHLRLRLDNDFGNSFLTGASSNFINNEVFISFFKGIHVRANPSFANETGGGVIASFNLLAGMSKLTFYYTNDGDTTKRNANFEINSSCPRFNRYEHDYSTAQFGNVFPVPGNNKLYIQSMAGVKVRLKFPDLKNLTSSGPVSVNKAELIIPVIENSNYKNHQNLLVFGVDSAGAEALIPDLLFETENYYGGSYSPVNKQYSFTISRYVQRVLSGRIPIDFGLSLSSSFYDLTGGKATGLDPKNAFRTIIPGTSSPGEKIRLKLTYSKLN